MTKACVEFMRDIQREVIIPCVGCKAYVQQRYFWLGEPQPFMDYTGRYGRRADRTPGQFRPLYYKCAAGHVRQYGNIEYLDWGSSYAGDDINDRVN